LRSIGGDLAGGVKALHMKRRSGVHQALEVLAVFLKLGCVAFGGPVAHLGYFRTEFVERRGWVEEAAYADIVALCQFLPGPASSQVGIAIGVLRAGALGAVAAWVGFTLPSAAIMILFGYGVAHFGNFASAPWLHGLKIVAVAVVAQAVWAMAKRLTPDAPRVALALAAAAVTFTVPSTLGQVAAITAGGVVGWWGLKGAAAPQGIPLLRRGSRGRAVAALLLFFLLLAGLPVAASLSDSHALALVDRFYRAGALVFGGGHVVLPLLQAAVVPPGWVGNDAFLAGYGAAQAVPGPLFSFSAYLGTVMRPQPHGLAGGLLCLAAIYLPSFLLIAGALPFWSALRHNQAMQRALAGVNAAVVGLLLAALYRPVWTSAIFGVGDAVLAVIALLLLTLGRLPSWLVVILGALTLQALARFA
jgi:chromate transporter